MEALGDATLMVFISVELLETDLAVRVFIFFFYKYFTIELTLAILPDEEATVFSDFCASRKEISFTSASSFSESRIVFSELSF